MTGDPWLDGVEQLAAPLRELQDILYGLLADGPLVEPIEKVEPLVLAEIHPLWPTLQ